MGHFLRHPGILKVSLKNMLSDVTLVGFYIFRGSSIIDKTLLSNAPFHSTYIALLLQFIVA